LETVVETIAGKTEQAKKRAGSARKGFVLFTLIAILAGYLIVA